MRKISKALGARDFAEIFGTDAGEVIEYCGELLKSLHFDYSLCSQEMREKIFIDVLKKCDDSKLSVSGSHRISEWRRGWGQNLQEFHKSGGDLNALSPKDWHGDRPLRYRGNYILANSDTFEHDFTFVFKYWLYKKYFREFENIYEFGCGTGHNLVIMARLFPAKQLFGMDWVPESQQLLTAIAARHGWPIRGAQFDFFKPDHQLEILPKSLVYTSSALEQLGSDFTRFLDYLLAKKPALCVNVECMAEYYDENCLFDYVALSYHRKRNYLDGFLTRLRALEKDRVIKIIAARRTGFGSLYHEGYMYVIWKIL